MTDGLSRLQLWLLAVLVGAFAVVIFRKPLGKLLKLAAKTAAGLCFLAIFAQVGGGLGVTLGVNLVNALVLALLGVPGFGLLLMLNWALI